MTGSGFWGGDEMRMTVMKAAHSFSDTPSPSDVGEVSRRNVETIARIQREAENDRTVGERVADAFARAVGSWPFIIIQSLLLAFWVIANVIHVIKPWDPYPFILLNLALSFQAAYASPIIMMSQNRQARLADQRNHLALQIALLAEQEDTGSLQLLHKICVHLNIPVDSDTASALEQATDPQTLVQQIKKASESEP
jgi:uncharacterized membrane protein